MPRGKYVNHKGRNRHFTDVEELEEERKKAANKKWRKKNDEEDDDESGSENESETSEKEEASGSEEDSSDEDDDGKAKGVQGLIEIENPNRVKKKEANKVTAIALDDQPSGSSSKPELSRREREELEKQRAQANYQKMHAQGKTEQARADLARLAIIKQHRAEAAARREQEKKEKESKTKK